MNDHIHLDSRIRELVVKHGSLRAVERVTGINHAYLWRMMKGIKHDPSDNTLESLGLKRVTYYTRIR